MFEEELKIEKQKRKQKQIKKEIGRCIMCKFSGCNYIGEMASYPSYCHLRNKTIDRSQCIQDIFITMFCSHFKRVEESKDGE